MFKNIFRLLLRSFIANIQYSARPEQRVPMTRLRARIAERLLSAQQNMAILTTFNEINMKAVMDLRKVYKDELKRSIMFALVLCHFLLKQRL